jgi:hypothetical protein
MRGRAPTYTKFHRHGEEVAAGNLGNSFTTFDTWEVDESWLDDASLALNSLDNLLGEPISS